MTGDCWRQSMLPLVESIGGIIVAGCQLLHSANGTE